MGNRYKLPEWISKRAIALNVLCLTLAYIMVYVLYASNYFFLFGLYLMHIIGTLMYYALLAVFIYFATTIKGDAVRYSTPMYVFRILPIIVNIVLMFYL